MLTQNEKEILLKLLGDNYLINGGILYARTVPEHLSAYLKVGPHSGVSLPLRYDLANVEDHARILYCHVLPILSPRMSVFVITELQKNKDFYTLPVVLNLLGEKGTAQDGGNQDGGNLVKEVEKG